MTRRQISEPSLSFYDGPLEPPDVDAPEQVAPEIPLCAHCLKAEADGHVPDIEGEVDEDGNWDQTGGEWEAFSETTCAECHEPCCGDCEAPCPGPKPPVERVPYVPRWKTAGFASYVDWLRSAAPY